MRLGKFITTFCGIWHNIIMHTDKKKIKILFLFSIVTDSLFGAGGFNTPPANPPFLSSVSPLELVSKNYHSGTVSFSQVSLKNN